MSILLVDWGCAHEDGLATTMPAAAVSGTPLTMSQKTLAYLAQDHHPTRSAAFETDLAYSREKYVYTSADELESAAKSILLILSPTLKRSIRHQLSSRSRRSIESVLWDCWHDVLPQELLAMCREGRYSDIASWTTSNERLLFYQPTALRCAPKRTITTSV